ncbi:hypothetical protein PVAP13_2KG096100 [Panicum virgatum]|uniref:F-box domain-containing protein n=1 Tax=Panicum virgatum TaxID=38727 RepID=A0A8T0VZB0_PANVG|nr:hypothetical protein PVAP13_2KG096100 [Panicum virgatum]
MDFPKRGGAVAWLPDDLLMEILSRVPVKSLCRFKCVSKTWRELIADPPPPPEAPPDLGGSSAASDGYGGDGCGGGGHWLDSIFIDLVGRSVPLVDPSFSFPTEKLLGIKHVSILHSCNGLLLLRHSLLPYNYTPTLGYVVCNPATQEWVAVPSSGWVYSGPPEGEDEEDDDWEIADLRPSGERRTLEEGGKSTQLGSFWTICPRWAAPLCNGVLHFIVDHIQKDQDLIVAPWSPDCCESEAAFLGQSQGHHYCISEQKKGNSAQITIWVLEDYDKEEWVMKHSVSSLQLFGSIKWLVNFDYTLVAIHPDRNLIFISHRGQKLISYNMDSKEAHALSTVREDYDITPYVPYFAESPVLSNKH